MSCWSVSATPCTLSPVAVSVSCKIVSMHLQALVNTWKCLVSRTAFKNLNCDCPRKRKKFFFLWELGAAHWLYRFCYQVRPTVHRLLMKNTISFLKKNQKEWFVNLYQETFHGKKTCMGTWIWSSKMCFYLLNDLIAFLQLLSSVFQKRTSFIVDVQPLSVRIFWQICISNTQSPQTYKTKYSTLLACTMAEYQQNGLTIAKF